MLPQDTTPAGKVCGVYVIENTVNGMVYIGSSGNIVVRWANHRHRLNGGRHESAYLQRAWNKYGSAAFTFRVIVITAAAGRRVAEAVTMRAYGRERVYNSMEPSDGSSVMTHSAETKRRIGAKSLGHTLSEDARRRISEARRGKPLSVEHRAKLSAAKKGRRLPAEALRRAAEIKRGSILAPEVIVKLSVARREWWRRRKSGEVA